MAEGSPKKKWVKNVVEHMHKGALREKAERAGETTGAYARQHEHDKGVTGEQARLGERLMAMHKGSKKHASSRENMNSFYGKGKE